MSTLERTTLHVIPILDEADQPLVPRDGERDPFFANLVKETLREVDGETTYHVLIKGRIQRKDGRRHAKRSEQVNTVHPEAYLPLQVLDRLLGPEVLRDSLPGTPAAP